MQPSQSRWLFFCCVKEEIEIFTINVKENNAVKKYICSSAKAVAAKMSELALWTKDVQISWGDDVYGTAYDAQRQIPANDFLAFV